MKANIIFNAEYSPMLNPIEHYFNLLKKGIKVEDIRTRYVLNWPTYNIIYIETILSKNYPIEYRPWP